MLTGLDVRATPGTQAWMVSELSFSTERRKKSGTSFGDSVTEEYRNVLSLTVYYDWFNVTNVDSITGTIGTITGITVSFNGAKEIMLKATSGSGFSNWRQLRDGIRPIALPGGDGMRQTINYASTGTWADLDWDTTKVTDEPMRLVAKDIDTKWDITGLDNAAQTRPVQDSDPDEELEEGRNVLMLTRKKVMVGIKNVSQFKTGLYSTPVVRGLMNGGPDIVITPGTGFSNFLITEFAIMPTGAAGCEQCIVSERHEVATDYSQVTWSD